MSRPLVHAPLPRPDLDALVSVAREARYDLHHVSKLAARDDRFQHRWLDGFHPWHDLYFRLRNRRITPRKEFYETAAVVEVLADVWPGVREVWDMGAGHGMTGLFVLAAYRNVRRAVMVDRRQPEAYERVLESLAMDRAFVKARARFVRAKLDTLRRTPPSDGFVVGVHCCGGLTDMVADLARKAGCDFAVVPCCESRKLLKSFVGEVEGAALPGEAISDTVCALRVDRWRGWGYEVSTRMLPDGITDRPRVVLARRPAG